MDNINKYDYKKIKPFKWFVLENFPFIEADFDAITEYQLFCKVVEYLNKVINATNAMGTTVEEFTDYVSNYFENLDVQDEINNKLNEMAEDGTLQEIISEYLNSKAIFGFDSVEDMKSATNLINGSYARTFGYYSVNDGGGALYNIRNYTLGDVIDNAFLIQISNELVAELIIDKNVVSIRQLGAKSQDKENHKYDVKTYIEKYINYISVKENRCRLYIPAGVWHCSPLEITNPYGFDIFGDFGYYNYGVDSTVITSLTNNQQYILKIGTNTGTYLKNWNLENILFSTYDYEWRENDNVFFRTTPKNVASQVLEMVYVIHGKMNNVLFINVVGQAMKMSACWENSFGYIVFRYVSNPTGSILCFDKDTTYGANAGISSTDFEKLYFESTHGDLIEFKPNCNFANNHIGIINFEQGEMNYNEAFTYTNIADDLSNIPENLIHYYILKLSGSNSNVWGNKIESIELNSFARQLISNNNNTYCYDSVLFTGTGTLYLGLLIDTINSTETRKDIVIYKNTEDNTPSLNCFLIINAVGMYGLHDFVFDVKNAFQNIKCGGVLTGGTNRLITKMNSNLTAFADVLSPVQSQILNSDKDSINPLHLCPKLIRYAGTVKNGKIINTGLKMKVRCKIPNGETYTFRLENEDSTHSQNSAFTGTGNFEWYEIELNQYLNTFGQALLFKTSGGTNPDNVLLDCFTFIN